MAIRSEIAATDWATRFLAECPTSYREAIDLAVRIAEENSFVAVE